MSIAISIITVTFNSEKTIERTIQSILRQTFKNFEYIVIDGGSIDATNEIIASYKEAFNNRIIHISEPDDGIYDAMNKGIALATGKLVGLLNSDDYYFENTLSTIYKSFVESDKNSVLTGALVFKNGPIEQVLKTGENRFLRKMRQYKNGVRHPATFIPKKIYDEIGLFRLEYKIASDAELIHRIHKADYSFKFIDKPLLVMSDGGISNSKGITQQILKEKKLLLKAYCPNPIKRIYYLLETKIRFTAKEFTASLLRVYRKTENGWF